jgi:hypothetical protein
VAKIRLPKLNLKPCTLLIQCNQKPGGKFLFNQVFANIFPSMDYLKWYKNANLDKVGVMCSVSDPVIGRLFHLQSITDVKHNHVCSIIML